MNFFLRKNGSATGPMSQADFLARLASGEYAATDEMSTDGRVWTRLGVTGYARSLQIARTAAAPLASPVVPDLTQSTPPPGVPLAGSGEKAVPDRAAPPPRAVPVHPGARNARRPFHPSPFLAVACLVAILGGAAWFLLSRRGADKAAAAPGAESGASMPARPQAPSASEAARGAARPAPEAAGGIAPSLPATAEEFLDPSEEDIRALFDEVRRAPAVAENARYAAIMRGVGCHLAADDRVNAFATWETIDSGALVRCICYTTGHARFDRLVAAMAVRAVVAEGKTDEQRARALRGLLRWMPQTLRADGARLTAETAAAGLAAAGIGPEQLRDADFARAAVEVANGIALSTFSHETGHHVLGHLDERGSSSQNLVRDRAKEEQADSFSIQVMSTFSGDARERVFLGRFLWAFEMAIAEGDASDGDSTHPLARKRLRALVESDPALAAKFGLDYDALCALLDELCADKAPSQSSAEVAVSAPAGVNGAVRTASPAFLEWNRRGAGAEQAPLPESGGVAKALGLVPDFHDMGYLSALAGGIASESDAGYPARARARAFDLRDERGVTPVRDQGNYGTCWAHAAIGSLESAMLLQGGQVHDFSENNLVNRNGWDIFTGWQGGNAFAAANYFLRWGGPVDEADDPYANPAVTNRMAPKFHIQQIRWIPGRTGPLDNGRVKAAIVQYGALWASYCHDSDAKYVTGSGDYYYYGKGPANHAVTLVGWDDDYPASAFATQPPGNGAFLIKNSWGTDAGDDGYYHVSYYDAFFGRAAGGNAALYAFCGADSAANFAKRYEHDPYGFVTPCPWAIGNAFPRRAANVFRATGDDRLAAVGLYALGPDTAYTLSIHVGVEADDPASGLCAIDAQSGTLDTAGYATIPLRRIVPVRAGERFSVVVELKTPGIDSPLAMELSEALPGGRVFPSTLVSAGKGESFLSPNGRDWIDIYAAAPQNKPNVCCKVYANPPASSAEAAVPGASPGVLGEVNPAFLEWNRRQSNDGGAAAEAAPARPGQRPTGLAPDIHDMSYLGELGRPAGTHAP